MDDCWKLLTRFHKRGEVQTLAERKWKDPYFSLISVTILIKTRSHGKIYKK